MAATQSQLFCFNTFAQTPINWQMNQAQALAAQLSPLCTPTPYIPPTHPTHRAYPAANSPSFLGQATKLRHRRAKAVAENAVHGNRASTASKGKHTGRHMRVENQ